MRCGFTEPLVPREYQPSLGFLVFGGVEEPERVGGWGPSARRGPAPAEEL